METWIATALWIIWALWSILEVTTIYTVVQHNSSLVMVQWKGQLRVGPISTAFTYLWLIVSIFWLCWHFA